MTEDDDMRIAKAAMKSLRVPAPESLTADLKRLARRRGAPSAWERLKAVLADGTWAYGAGAAFAAAAVGGLLLLPGEAPWRPAALDVQAPDAATREAVAAKPEAASPQALADLWSDDDGGDHDEI